MKRLSPFLFLFSLRAMAQTGGAIHLPVSTINVCASNTAQDAYCGGYAKVVCADNFTSTTTTTFFWCNPRDSRWDAVASGSGGGGGSTDFSTLGSGLALNKTFVIGNGSFLTFNPGGTVVATSVTCTDCVSLGGETTGGYAGSTSEGGPASDLGCSSCVSMATELDTFPSSEFAGKVTDESGTGKVILQDTPTVNQPHIIGPSGNCCARFNSSNELVCSTTGDCLNGDTGGGGGDSILIEGTAVVDGTGVNYLGGAGIDISFVSASTPDTATFVLDPTEVTSATWGDGSTATVPFTFNVSTGTDPVLTPSSTGMALNVPFDVADQTTAPGNYDGIRDNDVNLTPDPTCANSGSDGELHFLDSDESASDQWDACDGTSLKFRFPATSTSTIGFMATTATAGVYANRSIIAADLPAVSNNVTFTMDGIATGDIAAAHIPAASTVTRVNCWVTGTSSPSVATVNVNIRAQATPTTGGTSITTTAYTCDTTTINTAQAINNAAITAGQWMYLTFGAVTGTTNLVVSVDYTTP